MDHVFKRLFRATPRAFESWYHRFRNLRFGCTFKQFSKNVMLQKRK